MFVISKHTVKKILSGELGYDERPYDEDNEISKGFHFEDQAKVNMSLEKNHEAVCSALEEKCKKESCAFYKLGAGKLKDGWSCREYKVDFPTASFDARFHVALIGNDRVDAKETIDNLVDLERQGARFVCLNCYRPYEKKPMELYKDGHGGRYIEMCRCGSDIFDCIKQFIERLKE